MRQLDCVDLPRPTLRRSRRRRGAARIPPLVVAGLAAASFVVVPAVPAAALDLVTDYPGIAVEPGGNATFALKVTSPSRQRVALAVVAAPAGWRTVLRGGGSQISAVYSDPANPPAVELQVQVPADAPAGVHRVVVRASAGPDTRELPLDLTVAQEAAGAFTFSSEFNRLRGAPTATFRFEVSLENASARRVTFTLAGQGPEGWKVDARPTAQQQAATLSVDAGGKGALQVEADPPDDVPAGEYPIRVSAVGGGQTVKVDLTAEVTGTPQLTFATASERLNVRGRAGRRTGIGLVVSNDGSAPLAGVTLSGSPPSGWEVSFEPKSLPGVNPRQRVPVTAFIQPKGDAVAGDYVVTLTAAGGGASKPLEVRFAVQGSPAWGVLGVGLIGGAVAGIVYLFRRYGRR